MKTIPYILAFALFLRAMLDNNINPYIAVGGLLVVLGLFLLGEYGSEEMSECLKKCNELEKEMDEEEI